LLIILISCNTEEGHFPDAIDPAYTEFSLEKVGEMQIELNGVWDENQARTCHYTGEQPLLFLKMHESLVAINTENIETVWTLSESDLSEYFFGFYNDGIYDIGVFDYQDQLILSNGRLWHFVDRNSGTITQTVDMKTKAPGQEIFGFNCINGIAYFYAYNRNTKNVSAFSYSFPSEEFRLVKLYTERSFSFYRNVSIFPYGEDEKKLLLPFPIEENSDDPGAYFPFLNVETNSIDSTYLPAEVYQRESATYYDLPFAYENGVLSYDGRNGYVAFNLQTKERIWSERATAVDRMNGFLLKWDDDAIEVFDVATGESAIDDLHSSNVQEPPLIHPSEDIVCIPYRERIAFAELYTGQFLFEYEFPVQDTPYELVFFDREGRLCLLGRDQRLEFFNLPI